MCALHLSHESNMDHYIRTFTVVDLMEVTTPRPGETKVGQRLRVPQDSGEKLGESLSNAAAGGARFGLILVPEDVGPRANCGRAGANEGPAAFLTNFANLQDNRYANGGLHRLTAAVVEDNLLN